MDWLDALAPEVYGGVGLSACPGVGARRSPCGTTLYFEKGAGAQGPGQRYGIYAVSLARLLAARDSR